jgi:hypothetical protein
MKIVIPSGIVDIDEDDFPKDAYQQAESATDSLLMRLRHFHPDLDIPGIQDVKVKGYKSSRS